MATSLSHHPSSPAFTDTGIKKMESDCPRINTEPTLPTAEREQTAKKQKIISSLLPIKEMALNKDQATENIPFPGDK